MIAASLIAGGAAPAMAGTADSSQASARFLSGTLITSDGLLDALAALAGVTAVNAGSPTADTQTDSLHLAAALGVLQVNLPGGVSLPLSQFLKLGAVNQYAQASDNGLSRAGSGAVSDSGIVDLGGAQGFPADAHVDLIGLLGNPANGVLDEATVSLGAVTGVAALDASQAGPPAATCTDLSAPGHCRGYNVATATMNLSTPLVGTMVSSVNTSLDGVSTTVNGLSSTLLTSITGVVNDVLGALSGGSNDIAVTINADLRNALSTVLSADISNGGVTLSLANGTIDVDLATVIGGLSNRTPNTPLLSADVVNAVVTNLNAILQTLQTNINSELSTALRAVSVTISGGICMPALGCNGPLGGKLSLAYNGTLGDLAAGSATIVPSGTGAVPALLAPGTALLLSTLQNTLAGVVNPVLNSSLSTVATTTTTAVTTLTAALNPVLVRIGTVIGINLNVQESGATAGTFREVAARVSLLSGAGATVDLGRAEVGPNVVFIAPAITGMNPTHGPEAGGTVVTITGTDFTAGSTVSVDGGAAITPDSIATDGLSLTFTTPAHAPGAVPVTVTTTAGTSAPNTFTFDAATATALAITGMSPTNGPETGGTVVTITGTGFATGSTVSVDGGAAITPDSIATDGLSLTFTTPAHAPGAVPVTVTTTAGTSAPSTFTFDAVSGGTKIDEVTPDTGPTTGGTTVTIIGSCFTGATGVFFGTTAATSFTVISDTEIRAVSPAGTGIVDITVVGSATCGDATLDDGFTYVITPAPVSPSRPGTGALPATGVDVAPGAWTAFGLLLAGLALMGLRRRRRTT